MKNVQDYLPIIRHIARLYHTSFLEQEDLEQEAALSLLEWESENAGGPLGVAAGALERAATSDEAGGGKGTARECSRNRTEGRRGRR